jgi:hypothetical protein
MKQVTKKTLGVTALGAAITVAGAGAASANTGDALEGAGVAASRVVNSLPVEEAAGSLPAAASGTLDSVQQAPNLLGHPHPGKGQGKGGPLLGGLPLGGGALGG